MTASPKHVLDCLKNGQISKQEAEFYLKSVHGMTLEHAQGVRRPAILSYLFVSIFVIALVGATLFAGAGRITGFVTLSDEPIEVQQALGLDVSGVIYGDGNATVFLDTAEGSLTVAELTSDTGDVRTTKPSYAPGDIVELERAPVDASYYLDDGITSAAVDVPFAAPASNGTLLIVAQVNGTPTTRRLPVIIGDSQRETTFTQVCSETCTLNGTSGTIRIETQGDVMVSLDTVHIVTTAPNNEPIASAFAALALTRTVTIDLDAHFTDPDGDELSYSVGSDSHINATVVGSMLTIEPLAPGSGTLSIYASDLKTLVPASLSFTVGDAPEPVVESNETNTTETNMTEVNTTVPTVPELPSLDCSASDPNSRPVDCLNVEAQTYFEEDIFLENIDRTQVARVTPIGNLIITGRVFKLETSGRPGTNDFTIGYKDSDFNYVPTAWIDGQGNLHLRGQLHEENENLIPSQGSYAIINRRGVYMAYANPQTGDLYLRGNLIMFREDIHE